MQRSLILLVWLLTVSSAHIHAQRPISDREAAQLYLAVLGDMPPITTGRDVSLDPRLSSSVDRGARPPHTMDVWEHHLPTTSESPVVRGLQQTVQDLEYCTESLTRNNCLTSTGLVHVTFSAPVVRDSVTTVDATFVTRTFDERTSFDIQTWRYSFVMRPDAPVPGGRELQARGHGRMGGGK